MRLSNIEISRGAELRGVSVNLLEANPVSQARTLRQTVSMSTVDVLVIKALVNGYDIG